MADPEDVPTGVHCPGCGFENAPTTLYCQDCGAKLGIAPPSYLKAAAATAAPAGDAPAPVPKKPRILSAKRDIPLLGYAATAFRVLLGLALLLVVVQIFRAPADLPPPAETIDAQTLGEIRVRVAAASQRGETSQEWPWSRLNAYLASVLTASANGAVPGNFARAVLRPRPGGFTLIIQKTALGIPIATSIHYKLVVRGRGLALEATGAALGRLPLPAWMAPVVERIAGDLAPALKFELDILRDARAVRLAPTGVQIQFAAPRPRP